MYSAVVFIPHIPPLYNSSLSLMMTFVSLTLSCSWHIKVYYSPQDVACFCLLPLPHGQHCFLQPQLCKESARYKQNIITTAGRHKTYAAFGFICLTDFDHVLRF